MTEKSKGYQITVEAQDMKKSSGVKVTNNCGAQFTEKSRIQVELNLRRYPVGSNYQLLVELKIAEKSNIIIRGAKLTEKSKGYQLL